MGGTTLRCGCQVEESSPAIRPTCHLTARATPRTQLFWFYNVIEPHRVDTLSYSSFAGIIKRVVAIAQCHSTVTTCGSPRWVTSRSVPGQTIETLWPEPIRERALIPIMTVLM